MHLVFMRPSQKPGMSHENKVTTVGWIAALMTVVSLGTTLASNISLNSDQSIEFGQGIAQSTHCDESIIITPNSTFNSSSNTFVISELLISDIARSCMGKRFVVNFYNREESIALNNEEVTIDFASDAQNGDSYEAGYWNNGSVVNLSNAHIASAIINTSENGLDGEPGKSEIRIIGLTADGSQALSASEVDHITVESQDSSYLRDFQRATLYGGTGGSEFTISCPSNEIVKNIEFSDYGDPVNGYFEFLQLDCVSVSNVNLVTTQQTIVDNYTYSGSHSRSNCQSGAAGIGLNLVNGDYISGVGMRCADFSSGTNQVSENVVGSSSEASHSWCPRGSWMTGAYGRKGAGIDAIGALCKPLSEF